MASFKLGWLHYLAITATLVAIAVITILVFLPGHEDHLAQWDLQRSRLPSLEREFGFQLKVVHINRADVAVISQVSPGGRFDQAGFRAGDVPMNSERKTTASMFVTFCRMLQDVEAGQEISFRVARQEGIERGDFSKREVRLRPIIHTG